MYKTTCKQGLRANRLPPPPQLPWALLESLGLESHESRPPCLPPARKLQTRQAETLLQVSPKLLSRGEVGLERWLTPELSSPHVIAIIYSNFLFFSRWKVKYLEGRGSIWTVPCCPPST